MQWNRFKIRNVVNTRWHIHTHTPWKWTASSSNIAQVRNYHGHEVQAPACCKIHGKLEFVIRESYQAAPKQFFAIPSVCPFLTLDSNGVHVVLTSTGFFRMLWKAALEGERRNCERVPFETDGFPWFLMVVIFVMLHHTCSLKVRMWDPEKEFFVNSWLREFVLRTWRGICSGSIPTSASRGLLQTTKSLKHRGLTSSQHRWSKPCSQCSTVLTEKLNPQNLEISVILHEISVISNFPIYIFLWLLTLLDSALF